MSEQFVDRDDFLGLKAKARRYDTVTCPWNPSKKMRIRNLTAKEHAQFEASTLSKKGGLVTERLVEAKRRLVVACVVGQDNEPFLQETDLESMEDTDGLIINSAYKEAARHCGIGEDEVEDLVKNSGKIPVSGSATDSPKSSV